MMKKIRIVSQISFFALFVLLFFSFERFFSSGHTGPFGWFLRLNPFMTVITSVAGRSIIAGYLVIALLVSAATVLSGRLFCGMVCPLGSMIDVVDRLVRGPREKKNNPLRPPVGLQRLKYLILVVLVVAAVVGVTFPLFMDPLLITTRFFALILKPITAHASALLQTKPPTAFSPSFLLMGGYAGAGATLVLMLVIFGTAVFDRRFWCQYICPSGAFFGLLSVFSRLRRKTDAKCNHCGICGHVRCPTRAISGDQYLHTSTAECILCGNCTTDKRLCSTFSYGVTPDDASHQVLPDIDRRAVIIGSVTGLLALPALARRSPRKSPYIPGLIRPPGAVEEPLFLSRCLTCGACIGVCPQKALHPGTLHDGLQSWNTPKLVARIGYCDETCTRCSSVCPTGALVPITTEQKKTLKIGTAVIDRSKCRPWLQQSPCTVCFTKCPYEAITMNTVEIDGEAWEVPEVNLRKCVGCGICEFYCPTRFETAIKVYAMNEKRISNKPAAGKTAGKPEAGEK